jgi:NCAIR mutase (PurE)-related protein
MNPAELRHLLRDVAAGAADAAEAERRILGALRATPYADLGFARVDHHRSIRQGFPEVVLGLGKTPAQIAAIASEIARQGSTLLVTRATKEAADAVQAALPGATYYPDAHIVALRQQDVAAGIGTIAIVAAGTADLPVAEEAARSAELMGNVIDRLYDVGVAGIHRLLAERARLDAAETCPVAD